jgi:putative transposase
MQHILITTLTFLVSCFKSRATLQLENIALRHQINIPRRKAPKRLRIIRWDRLILGATQRLWPEIVDTISIVQPAPLVRWHRGDLRRLARRTDAITGRDAVGCFHSASSVRRRNI